MKVPVPFLVAGLTALLALQGWTLKSVVEMKVEIAAIKATLSLKQTTLAVNQTKNEN
jgi:hypothetical protein